MIGAATAVALALATAGPATPEAPGGLGGHVCFVRHDCDRPPLFCLMDDACDVDVEICRASRCEAIPRARASWR